MMGRSAAEVIVAPKLMERGLEIIALLRDGKSWTGEFPVLRRDGTEIPVLVTDSPIHDVDGRLVGIIGVSVDLSERKHAELERLERTRLEALLTATAAAEQELSERLTLHVPYAGQLAADPRLPGPPTAESPVRCWRQCVRSPHGWSTHRRCRTTCDA